MLSALRRAWQRYLDSIPRSEEPAAVSDAQILREMHPPHPAPTVQAFADLAALVTAHLPEPVAEASRRALTAKLRRGVSPQEALVRWIGAHNGPKSRNLGLMALDWKAVEEIGWQAQRIAKAHSVDLVWTLPVGAEAMPGADDLPVSPGLRSLAAALSTIGLALIATAHDDSVCAFALPQAQAGAVRELCDRLRIELLDLGAP